MAGGGGDGSLWKKVLVGGVVLLGAAYALDLGDVDRPFLHPTLLAIGGLAVIFGSVESMIVCVEGVGKRLRWNTFVAGAMAGLAGNIPELVMLGFVLAAEPRVGFIVVALTLHVGAMGFGVYSGLLPRNEEGHAKLPEPLVKLSTDIYATAGAVFLATGSIMVTMNVFDAGDHRGEGLDAYDLYTIGALLLGVQVVALVRLVQRFSASDETEEESASTDAEPPMPIGSIVAHGAVGLGASVIGGHAVGDFADVLVNALTAAGYSEMIGALILSVFACAGGYAMIASAHMKGLYDIALANVSGAITQNAVLVLPVSLILIAAFSQLGIVPVLPHGGVLPIDLETTSVLLLMFPPMLILWKAVQDDGYVSWVETAGMVAIFGLTLYFLARHG
jgi:hypothetical protein